MKIKKAETQFEFFSIMKVRSLVFMCEQQVDPSIEIDDADTTCDHYCLYDGDVIVATLRVIPEGTTWHIGRVAVLKTHRHKQYGSALMNYVEEIARASGATKLELGAQIQAAPFYASLGYTGYGDLYDDANIEHQMMEKYL